MTAADLWDRYSQNLCVAPSLGLTLDYSRMRYSGDFFPRMQDKVERAYDEMRKLEAGATANPDESRMVGHYWLRAPQLAPTPELQREIAAGVEQVKSFAARVHADGRFTGVLCIGIGGSALGPMFVADALGGPSVDRMQLDFLDNTDPDGIRRVLQAIGHRLDRTPCIVTSKSGGTPETRNGMIMAAHAWQDAGLDFGKHAVAITMPGSKLDKQARDEGWLERFAMFDWIGGRTSELSAVGLLPAALQGLDIDEMLRGAATRDEVTRTLEASANPSMLLALMWYHGTNGRGARDMVVLPYKDRLLLFSRYLQQLVMESLGKASDLHGNRVEQGISVYGNKGSTDQHAYVQQLREGVNNFFVTFVRVLEDGPDMDVGGGVTAGDYLHAFLLGTREALASAARESITITVRRVDPFSIGVLIALFERAVGFYATMIGINAYHQPGVEAGKKAADAVLKLQVSVETALTSLGQTAQQVAESIGAEQTETVSHLLEHLAANGRAERNGDHPSMAVYSRL